jgi:hypothetical protein
MKEFLEAINQYPFTTFLVVIALIAIGNAFSNKK